MRNGRLLVSRVPFHAFAGGVRRVTLNQTSGKNARSRAAPAVAYLTFWLACIMSSCPGTISSFLNSRVWSCFYYYYFFCSSLIVCLLCSERNEGHDTRGRGTASSVAILMGCPFWHGPRAKAHNDWCLLSVLIWQMELLVRVLPPFENFILPSWRLRDWRIYKKEYNTNNAWIVKSHSRKKNHVLTLDHANSCEPHTHNTAQIG